MTDQHQTEAQRLAALLRSRNNNQAGFGLGPVCDEAAVELLRLNSVHADLERVSMQLVACGVVAMADTPDSAKKARAMHPDYESVSCDDVKRRVDECIELRARVAELEDMLANLPLSSLQRLRARIQRLEEMLAAVGAGGVGPLIPSKLTARDIADSALLGNIESPFNACMHQEHCKRWKKEAEAEQQFSARDDAERLKSVARGMSYNDHGEAVWKHTLMEIAVRLEAGGYAAPQPPTTEQSSVVERPQGERHPGVLMPSRSLVDQVIREISRYCNTGEMDDAESLLASLQLSLDPDQQPPTTEQSSAVDQPGPAYLLRDLADDIGVKALDLIAAIRAAGLGDYSVNMMLPAKVCVAMCQRFAAAPQPPEHYEQQALDLCLTCGWKTLIPGDCLNCARQKPQVEQEPVAWYDGRKFYGNKAAASMNMANMSVLSPVYTHPQPKREPLTVEAVLGVAKSIEIQFDSERLNEQIDDILAFARAIERAHGIGGEA